MIARPLASALVGTLFASILASPAAVADEVSSYAMIEPSLALVVTGQGKSLGFGTAFCVESAGRFGLLLTNKHVVGADPHPRVVLMSNPTQPRTSAIVRVAGLVDAVVLAINSNCRPVTISNTIPPVGTRIAIAGFPTFQLGMFIRGLGLSPSFHEGSVSSIIGDGALLQYDAQTDLGNSGSPLFDAESAQVYGLVRAVSTGGTGALQNNIAIGSVMLQAFLQNAFRDVAKLVNEGPQSDADRSSGESVGIRTAGVRFFRDTLATVSAGSPDIIAGIQRFVAGENNDFADLEGDQEQPTDIDIAFYASKLWLPGASHCSVTSDKGKHPDADCWFYAATLDEAKALYNELKQDLKAAEPGWETSDVDVSHQANELGQRAIVELRAQSAQKAQAIELTVGRYGDGYFVALDFGQPAALMP